MILGTWNQRQKLLDPEVGVKRRNQQTENEASVWCKSLTYQERIIGWATCFLLGFLLSFGSTFRFARLVRGHPGSFAVAYTLGNLLSISSSMFFVGPTKQVETMFAKKRRYSAIAYIFFIVLTLTLCFAPHVHHRVGFVLLSVLCQFSALIWYTLSYIPYGRSIAKSCCKRMVGLTPDDEM